MRLYHFTSHEEALAIVADGFRGADDLTCFLLTDRPDAVYPLSPAVAVLEVQVRLEPEVAAAEIEVETRSGPCRMYYLSARHLARARIRLYDAPPGEFRGGRLA